MTCRDMSESNYFAIDEQIVGTWYTGADLVLAMDAKIKIIDTKIL